ncbi:hypothetical protein [Pseudoalteromonas sp. MMG024]|uniref:hypothetical protein n=1 Tax=Pseudoalteromonas sp. MMG024 TaxID=2909980 RepID=UPI001F418215|nr:hypothetical protein [Pseudoalteromonas sp. MMG024]MCF6458059.1 hypothetical protein [Pseudoalteromonas sp. MMG024]
MFRIYLEEASIVTVIDCSETKNEYLGEVLFGVIKEDESFRYRPFEQVTTSKIVEVLEVDDKLEINTINGTCYIIDKELSFFAITAEELVIMKAGQYLPSRIIQLRTKHYL